MRSVNIQYLQVEDNTSLIRDVSSNAVINNNDVEYEQYRRRKDVLVRQNTQIQNQVKEIDSLRRDMTEIKQMLSALLLKADK